MLRGGYSAALRSICIFRNRLSDKVCNRYILRRLRDDESMDISITRRPEGGMELPSLILDHTSGSCGLVH